MLICYIYGHLKILAQLYRLSTLDNINALVIQNKIWQLFPPDFNLHILYFFSTTTSDVVLSDVYYEYFNIIYTWILIYDSKNYFHVVMLHCQLPPAVCQVVIILRFFVHLFISYLPGIESVWFDLEVVILIEFVNIISFICK